ncbi:MAG: single-stranded-DNA-specific exonuclease RecJ [Planctomycetota bacterium]|nr:single-stranded-DNA-specific exonuclease RecJ [Planctomycetota bacterium]
MSSREATSIRPWHPLELDEEQAAALAKDADLNPLIARLLVQRGITTTEDARAFLDPRMLDLLQPDEIPDIDVAVEMILAVRDAGGTIAVFGDYDVDGISGTAVLLEMLHHLGVETVHRLPDRVSEGYGLHPQVVDGFAEAQVDLIITVDGGSNDHEALLQAQQLGIEVIVTDHHPVHQIIEGVPLVHPDRPDRPSLSRGLCGAGVAYKLCWALAREDAGGEKVNDRTRDLLVELLAFTSLGTVADVVPLVGENRIIVKQGLRALSATRRPGLEALMEVCRIDRQQLGAIDIGFRIGPHLNAAGRIGNAEDALELLLTDDPQRGQQLAQKLSTLNQQRKEIESQVVEDCRQELEEGQHPQQGPVVFARQGWHPGVVGIVASRISEQIHRPVWILCIEGDVARGSGRSIPGLPLSDLYTVMRPLVQRIGGHAAAGGLTMDSDRIDALRETLAQYQGSLVASSDPPVRHYDLELKPAELNLALADEVERLAPFGQANSQPLFKISGLRTEGTPRLVGRGEEHVQVTLGCDGSRIPAIWFRSAGRARELTAGGELTVLAHVGVNQFRGRHLQLQIIDLLPASR